MSTQEFRAELVAAADKIEKGTSVANAVEELSEQAYELGTRASEDLNAVGLTGLVEDYYDGNAEREDISLALLAASNGATINSALCLSKLEAASA